MRGWWVHIRKGKSRTCGHRKSHWLYYLCYNSLLGQSQKQKNVKWYFQVDQRKIYFLINRTPSPMKGQSLLAPKRRPLLVVSLSVTNRLFLKSPNFVFDRLLHLQREFFWLTDCVGITTELLVIRGSHYIISTTPGNNYRINPLKRCSFRPF